MQYHQLNAALENKIVIGITGHRDILPEVENIIKIKVRDELSEIKNENTILLSSLASGSDQLVTEIASELNIPFIVILPMKEEFYKQDFKQDGLEIFNTFLKKAQNVFIADELTAKNKEIEKEKKNQGEKTGKERNEQYESAGLIIAIYSHHLIALWDGVYNGKCGGTSEIVRNSLLGFDKNWQALSVFNTPWNKTRRLHHLLTPRSCNHFPVHDSKISLFPYKELEWADVSVPLRSTSSQSKWKTFYDRYKYFILKFIIPFLLASVTFIFGIYGFHNFHNKDESFDKWDALYASVNLITLNSSVLHNKGPVPVTLQIARISGLLTFTYAILGAFLLAAKNFRKKAKILFWRKKFYLIIGLNERSFNLIKDLRRRKSNVAVLNNDKNSNLINSCENIGAIVYYGNPAEIYDLNFVYFQKAKNIFVFTESDTENVRIMQAIDQHIKNDSCNFYVHVNDLKQKEFLSRTTKTHVQIFNIYENAARRLLFKHPLDRFQYHYYKESDAKAVQLILIGFDDIAWEIALSALRMTHYSTNVSFELIIFGNGDEQKAHYDKFKNSYGIVFQNDVHSNTDAGCLKNKPLVIFEMLPQSDADLSDPHTSLIFKLINKNASVSMFTCLSDSLKSAAYLSLLLPGLNYLKQKNSLNMQIFCCYNSPDEKEEEYVEYKINKIGTHIPIYCFGNFLKVCTEEEIKNNLTDNLAKQLAFWYYLIYNLQNDKSDLTKSVIKNCSVYFTDKNETAFMNWAVGLVSKLKGNELGLHERIKAAKELLDYFWNEKLITNGKIESLWNSCWLQLTENDKESNRQAADHIFIKLRCIGVSINEIKAINIFHTYEIELLASIEHRRWCAEKLLDGWHLYNNKEKWHKDKTLLKEQKLHYDLRNFDNMEEYEKNKDHNQIIGIPYFLRFCINNNLITSG